MRKLNLYIITIGLLLSSCKKTVEMRTNTKTETLNEDELLEYITSKMEYAYFEGQRDLLQGSQRIDFTVNDNTGDTCWHWTTSPWNGSTKQPIYQPPCK